MSGRGHAAKKGEGRRARGEAGEVLCVSGGSVMSVR